MRVLLATIVATLLLAAPALAVTETDSLGPVRAELSYDKPKEGPPKNLRLRVFEGKDQIVDRAIPNRDFFSPAYISVEKPSVKVLDLDGDGDGEAVFDLYSGGAHCCLQTYIYDGVTEIDLFTGNVGYRFRDVDDDGVKEIVTADDRFSSRYSSFAASLQPLQLARVRDGELEYITGTPVAARLLRREIRSFTRLMTRVRKRPLSDPSRREIVRSALAGITADHCNLGDCDRGYDLVGEAIDLGEVRRSFTRRLDRDLRRFGYVND